MILTRGETWRLLRLRAGLRQPAFAAMIGISADKLRDWEHDIGSNIREPAPENLCTPEPLTPGEWCRIQRSRRGWTLETAALEIGTTRVTLHKAEQDGTRGVARIVRFYRAAGVQQPASTALPGWDVAEGPALAAIQQQGGA